MSYFKSPELYKTFILYNSRKGHARITRPSGVQNNDFVPKHLRRTPPLLFQPPSLSASP